MSKKNKSKNKKEVAVDVVKETLQWIVVTAVAFGWWLAVLLLLSLFLLNVWIVTFEKILSMTIVLTVVSSVVYLGWLVYRRVKA